ncbi:MAG TPA: cupin domain-containing protein [Flavisolibacter sp.]|nr:cupin domain-containing protein [Flavisolibacter sp.]
MAFPNKSILNPVIGQQLTFLKTTKDTNGTLLEIEATYLKASQEPPPHFHPFQEETFTVLTGRIQLRINGVLTVLETGESIHLPKHTIHSMWNEGPEPASVNWRTYPALDTEYFLETSAGLAIDGKTNAKGMPGLLQVALLASRFSREFRLARPSYTIQKLLFMLLKPVARLKGYRSTYPHHID